MTTNTLLTETLRKERDTRKTYVFKNPDSPHVDAVYLMADSVTASGDIDKEFRMIYSNSTKRKDVYEGEGTPVLSLYVTKNAFPAIPQNLRIRVRGNAFSKLDIVLEAI